MYVYKRQENTIIVTKAKFVFHCTFFIKMSIFVVCRYDSITSCTD